MRDIPTLHEYGMSLYVYMSPLYMHRTYFKFILVYLSAHLLELCHMYASHGLLNDDGSITLK